MLILFLFLALLGFAYGLAKLLQKKMNSWGATTAEQSFRMPGEEFLTDKTIVSTHAITIHAKPEEIWPWLIQIGVDRGGFYSYSWLENIFGCGIRNVDHLVPELQNLKVNDKIFLHPKAPALRVTRLEKNRCFSMDGWVYYLQPTNAEQTRLLSRTYPYPLPKKNFASNMTRFIMSSVFYDLIHFIMSQKQLTQLKFLVERHIADKTKEQNC